MSDEKHRVKVVQAEARIRELEAQRLVILDERDRARDKADSLQDTILSTPLDLRSAREVIQRDVARVRELEGEVEQLKAVVVAAEDRKTKQINWHNEWQASQAELARERKVRQEAIDRLARLSGVTHSCAECEAKAREIERLKEDLAFRFRAHADAVKNWRCSAKDLAESIGSAKAAEARAAELEGAYTHEFAKAEELRREIELERNRADNHRETLRSIRHMLSDGVDAANILMWATDALAGYTQPVGVTLYERQARADAAEARVRELEGEVERLREDYGRACLSIAKMHGAFFGFGNGPRRGVTEDMQDKAAELARLSGVTHACAECESKAREIEALKAEVQDHHDADAFSAENDVRYTRQEYRERLDRMVAAVYAGRCAGMAGENICASLESDNCAEKAVRLLVAIDAFVAKREAK